MARRKNFSDVNQEMVLEGIRNNKEENIDTNEYWRQNNENTMRTYIHLITVHK